MGSKMPIKKKLEELLLVIAIISYRCKGGV